MERDHKKTAPVQADTSIPTRRMPCLMILAGPDQGKVFLLRSGEHVLGRGRQVDFPLASKGVSRRHAAISCSPDRVVLRDLKSTNGSWCNGRVVARVQLKDGDHLQLGECRLAFRLNLPAEDRLLRQLYRRATRDALTGLLNRACLEDRLAREVRHHQRYRRGLAVIQLDLDHFKRVNDEFGHAAGDRALKAAAGALRACLRGSDLAGRLGGEEFLLVLPEADLDLALGIAEKVRAAIAAGRLELAGRSIRVTASCGVASAGSGEISAEELVKRADRACYRAKETGRDRVVASEAPAGPGPRVKEPRAKRLRT